MTSSFTTNKTLEKPGNGDYVDTWNVPVNGDLDIIDQSLGGTTSLNATGGSATLTVSQYRSLIISVAGAMSADVVYTIPSGVGGQWIIKNLTTDATGGPWTITFASAGGGTSYVVARENGIAIFSDGTNIYSFSSQGGAINNIFWENDQIIDIDYTITTGKNAGTFGPVSIETGVTVTVPSGSTWSIV